VGGVSVPALAASCRYFGEWCMGRYLRACLNLLILVRSLASVRSAVDEEPLPCRYRELFDRCLPPGAL